MDITPITPKGRQIINRYGDGGFVVNGAPYRGNILIMPDMTLAWEVTTAQDITAESLAAMASAAVPPELLLIGAGKHFAVLSQPLQAYLRSKHIGVDVMDTGAACRTYNVLLSEERRVAAALIAV